MMRDSVLRLVRRLLLAFGVAALAYTGGAIAYAGLYQRYQSWVFTENIAAYDALADFALSEDPLFRTDVVPLSEGDVLGRLEIPRIGVSVMIRHGVGSATLGVAVGHVPGTPLPGVEGNVALAGHRDTFFRRLEGILPGDAIRITTLTDTYEYTVDAFEIVGPEDTYVMESRARAELTLITCYPFYFVGAAPERFIVHATPADREQFERGPGPPLIGLFSGPPLKGAREVSRAGPDR
jgi:sortase A